MHSNPMPFYILIVKKLPDLWIALPLCLILGVPRQMFKTKFNKIIGFSGLFLVNALIYLMYVPDAIADNLSETLNKPAQQFVLQDLLTS